MQALELTTPEVSKELQAQKTEAQNQNINALNMTLSSHFLSNLIDVKKIFTEYSQEQNVYQIYNRTGLKILMRPERTNGECYL